MKVSWKSELWTTESEFSKTVGSDPGRGGCDMQRSGPGCMSLGLLWVACTIRSAEGEPLGPPGEKRALSWPVLEDFTNQSRIRILSDSWGTVVDTRTTRKPCLYFWLCCSTGLQPNCSINSVECSLVEVKVFFLSCFLSSFYSQVLLQTCVKTGWTQQQITSDILVYWAVRGSSHFSERFLYTAYSCLKVVPIP